VAAKLGFAVRGRGRGRSGEPMTVYELRRDASEPAGWSRRPRVDRGLAGVLSP